MKLQRLVDKFKCWTNSRGHAFGAVALHRKAATLLGTVESEGRYDYDRANMRRGFQRLNVCILLRVIGQEMKDGSVVPNLVGPLRLPMRNVSDDPRTLGRPITKPRFSFGKRCLCNV